MSAELSRREFIAMSAAAASGIARRTRQARSLTLPPYGNGTIPQASARELSQTSTA